MTISLSSNTKTIFEFDLPYAIPVPDGLYQIKIGSRTGTLSIKRVQRQNVAGFSGTGNIQLRFDKYGKSSYSKIQLTLPWIVNFQEQGRTPILLEKVPPRLKAKETVIRVLNRFIETVRYVTKEYWVEPARYQDILAYEAFYLDGKKKHPARLTLIDTGIGGIGIGTGHPFQMNKDAIEQLTDLLKNDGALDASRIFILDSKDACLQEDYRLATIEAVTALEIVLYKFIRKQGGKLGIAKGTLRNFIKETGLTGNISVVLKMLTQGLEQIDDEIINRCKGAITIRNKILHEGLRDVYSTDTEKRIIEIEKMLDYLSRLLATVC